MTRAIQGQVLNNVEHICLYTAGKYVVVENVALYNEQWIWSKSI